MRFRTVVFGVLAGSISVQATAGTLMMYPVQTGAETLRFQTGVPTLNLETPTGAIQITPLPFDHGKVAVGISVYNKGLQSANFGVENITAQIAGRPIAVLSSAELQKRAKSRAMWSQIGLAVLAGAAAAAVSQAHTTERSYGSFRTPRGTYRWASSYRDNSIGVLGATAAVAGGTAGIIGIQNRLDYTLENLSNEIIQTTTIDPDSSYGGRVVLEKDPKAKAPYDVRVVMSLNGTAYPFVFRVTKEGVNVPAPFVVSQVSAPVEQAAPIDRATPLEQAAPLSSVPAVLKAAVVTPISGTY
jgi:hypothetical protein